MKQIPNFPNYAVTKDGQVWSCRYNRWLKPYHNTNGYLSLLLSRDKKSYNCRVHRLVLETYVGPRPKGMECRHLNGNRQDNRLENLKWGTRSENTYDSVRHGTHNLATKLTTHEKKMIAYAFHYRTCTIKELADTYYVPPITIIKVIRDFSIPQHERALTWNE